jgi:hypothetical protein
MNKSNPFPMPVIIAVLTLAGVQLSPALAHNVSWNKAVVQVDEKRITLNLHISQFDLLDTIAPGRWKRVYRNKQEWHALLPQIRKYVFGNIGFTVDNVPLSHGSDLPWRLEHIYPTEEIPADTNLGILEIARSWDIDTVPEKIVLTLNLLKNVTIPVKWVILLKSDLTSAGVYPYFIDRGDVACYDFRKQAWVPAANNRNGLWRAIVLGVQDVWRCVTRKRK